MNWDLATILVLLVIISGLIWLYDVLFFAPRRRHRVESLSPNFATQMDRVEIEKVPFIVDLARSLFPIFLIVLVLRSFLVEPFRIPSGSMMPNLLIGDFILVNKFSYGIRLPVLNVKIFDIGEPERGDVMVFRYPEDPSIPFIKRVIGLPGDIVEYHYLNKMIYINGELVKQEPIGIYQGVGRGSDMTGRKEQLELLPGAEHKILLDNNNALPSQMLGQWEVPPNQYFVLGDNRDNSRDSRVWGFVPEENLVGKAFLIWMNWDLSNGGINWERLGTQIK
jgi:signal peptidase I